MEFQSCSGGCGLKDLRWWGYHYTWLNIKFLNLDLKKDLKDSMQMLVS